jgi:hypothetical protein
MFLSLPCFAQFPNCDTYSGADKLDCIGSKYRSFEKSYPKALEFFKKACDMNHASACYQADDLLRKNLKNPREAKKFREKACKLEKTFICDIDFDKP